MTEKNTVDTPYGPIPNDMDENDAKDWGGKVTEIHIGGDEPYRIALEVLGTFKVFYPDGTEELLHGKHSFCTCGQSKNKPFCDQSHQVISTPEGKRTLFEFLNDEERMEIMAKIGKEQWACHKKLVDKIE